MHRHCALRETIQTGMRAEGLGSRGRASISPRAGISLIVLNSLHLGQLFMRNSLSVFLKPFFFDPVNITDVLSCSRGVPLVIPFTL